MVPLQYFRGPQLERVRNTKLEFFFYITIQLLISNARKFLKNLFSVKACSSFWKNVFYFSDVKNDRKTDQISTLCFAAGAGSYSLTISTDVDGETVRIIEDRSVDLTGLTSGTHYNFQLRSIGDNGALSDDAAELEETTRKNFYCVMNKMKKVSTMITILIIVLSQLNLPCSCCALPFPGSTVPISLT